MWCHQSSRSQITKIEHNAQGENGDDGTGENHKPEWQQWGEVRNFDVAGDSEDPQSAVAALLSSGGGQFLLFDRWVEDLGGEATLHAVPPVAGDDLTHLHELVDVPGQELKGPVHVAVALGWRLHIADAELGRQLLGLVPAHLAVFVEVTLVADEDVNHVVGQDVLTHLLVPLSYVLKGLTIGEVEDQEPTHGVAVVGRRDGPDGWEKKNPALSTWKTWYLTLWWTGITQL